MHTIGEWWMWPAFAAFILSIIVIDLFFLGGGREHRVSVKESVFWTLVWIVLALGFNALLWMWNVKFPPSGTADALAFANQQGLEFFSVYLLEKSLSVDNLFVFALIFAYFKIPAEYQRRVLVFGILGAIVLRFLMITSGSWLVHEFLWTLYIFGLFLVITGLRMMFFSDTQPDLESHPLLRFLRKHCRITEQLQGSRFFWRKEMLWYVTPLFVVLVFIEISDVIFALDSVPAAFGVTQDAFIIFTANIFAILGLRTLYFLLAGLIEKFHLLKYGLALILVFIGVKMLAAYFVLIPIALTFCVIVVILAAAICASLLVKPKMPAELQKK